MMNESATMKEVMSIRLAVYEEIKDLSEEELRRLCETKVAELYQEAKRK
jgi:hypothetical protein